MGFLMSTTPRIQAKSWLYLGAALSLLAALVHIWVMQDHFEEWWGYGAFFLIVAIAQGIYGLALLNWPGRKLVLIGVAGTLVLIALYVVNHTTGVPYLGPHAGEPEKVKALGVVSKALEVALVLMLMGLLQSQRSSRPTSPLLQHQS